jgi:hypothetical protein
LIVGPKRGPQEKINIFSGVKSAVTLVFTERGEVDMDLIAAIVTALVLGANKGLEQTASAAVQDGYASLKRLITERFKGKIDPAVPEQIHSKRDCFEW